MNNVSSLRARASAPESTAFHTTLIIGSLMALVCLLALLFFGQQSLRLDEAQSLWQTSRSPATILTIVSQDVHVPLYHELLHMWRLFLGDSVGVARILSLAFYLLSIPALYFLGKLSYGRNAALMAASLFAISPFMNWYASEIRMYTLFTFLVIVNQYCFIKLWRAPTEHTWVGYIMTALAGIFTHYFFFLMLFSQVVFYALRRPLFPVGTGARLRFTWALIAIAFAPWVFLVITQGQAGAQSPHLAAPTTINLFSTFAQFLFGFPDDHLNTFVLSLWPLTLIAAFLGLRKGTALRPETEYLLLSVLLSITAAFAVSFVVPVFVSRYLIFAAPSLYLLLTVLFAQYPQRAGFWARLSLVCAMALMLAFEVLSPTAPVKEDYRDAADYLSTNVHAQDVILLSAPFTVYPVEYYYRGAAPLATLPSWDRYAYGPIPAFNPATLPAEVASSTASHQYVWVLLSYDQGYENTIKQYFDTHYERVLEHNFSPSLDLYEYKLRYDTPLSTSATSSVQ
jgi:mannosyltransferase